MLSHEETVAGVCECVGRVLNTEPSTIKLSDRILDDLGADSLDLLDLLFQLERRFSIRIVPGNIERKARAALGTVPLEVGGIYTPEALAELQRAMPEVPAEEFRPGMGTAELPRRFRVETFVNLVKTIQAEGGAA